MKNLFLICISFLFFTADLVAQNLTPISNDCQKPIHLFISSNSSYGATVSPNGFGKKMEIESTDKADKFAFKKEHNVSWYLLNIGNNGELVFDIIPIDSTNDYDFLLYRYTDSTFCENLANKKNKPVRSNISRAQKNGITGLSEIAKNNFVAEGVGDAYSSPIEVKKGEKYMLVLDNVYPNGKGHTIYFNFLKGIEIKGLVVNSDSIPLEANIQLFNNEGELLAKVKSSKDGTFDFTTSIRQNENYYLTFQNNSCFVSTSIINTQNLENNAGIISNKTVLQKLKKGSSYQLGNINFYGDSPELLPESYSSINALYMLMKFNDKMIIQIIGHVNDPTNDSTTKHNLELSQNRSYTVRDFLIKKGISEKRIKTIGLGSEGMLFPHANNEAEYAANRRVEIKIISIDEK